MKDIIKCALYELFTVFIICSVSDYRHPPSSSEIVLAIIVGSLWYKSNRKGDAT